MASARTFSQKKLTSPAPEGSALKPRTSGRDEGVSSSVKALQNERALQDETSSVSLGRISTDSSISPEKKSPKALRRNAWKALSREKKLWKSNEFQGYLMDLYFEAKKDNDKNSQKRALRVRNHSVRVCGDRCIPKYVTNKKGEKCETGAPGGAEVHAVGGGESSYTVWTWVRWCASTWFCPLCGPKVMARRREEIKEGLEVLKSEGCGFAFVTLTFPHRVGIKLQVYMERLQKALKLFRAGRAWADVKTQFGMKGYIRAQEVTYGWNSGWHPHFHELTIFDHILNDKESKAYQTLIRDRWLKVCKKVGLIEHGKMGDARLHAVDVRIGSEPVAQEYLTKTAVWELSSRTTKAARAAGSVHPHELLALACEGDTQAKKLWAEYAVGMYSRVAVYWSPLLKKYCGIADKTDEELLQGSTDEAILGVPEATYRSIANYRYQPVILELVENNKVNIVEKFIKEQLRGRCKVFRKKPPDG